MLFKMNPIELASKIPHPKLSRKALDVMLTIGIPFNRWLSYRIEEMSSEQVIVVSPVRKLRENHVGGAHACALALLGEYPAGVLLANVYPFDKYRLIISELHITYHKQGRGNLKGIARAPKTWPQASSDEETWVQILTEISNEKNEPVATCQTKWQVKDWSQVRSR